MDEKKSDEPNLASSLRNDGYEKHTSVADYAAIVRDGMPVHPQPTSDPLDPLNWSSLRKHSILFIVCFNYWMFTYITTTT